VGIGINLRILTFPEFTYGNGLHIPVSHSLDKLVNGTLLMPGLLKGKDKAVSFGKASILFLLVHPLVRAAESGFGTQWKKLFAPPPPARAERLKSLY
jgi:hypothetical protein